MMVSQEIKWSYKVNVQAMGPNVRFLRFISAVPVQHMARPSMTAVLPSTFRGPLSVLRPVPIGEIATMTRILIAALRLVPPSQGMVAAISVPIMPPVAIPLTAPLESMAAAVTRALTT